MAYRERKMRRAVKTAVKRIIRKNLRSGTMAIPGRRGQGAALYTKRTTALRTLEKKVVDVLPFTVTIDNAGDQILLNGVKEGSAFYNRVGNEIEMLSVHVVGQVVTSGVSLANLLPGGWYGRIMVVYDRQPNSSPFVISDLIASWKFDGTSSTTSRDHLNPNNKDRFLILRDSRIAVPDAIGITGAASQQAMSVVDYSTNQVNVNMYVPLRGLSARYKASTGLVGDITIGSLYLFLFGDTSTDSTHTPYSFVGSARLTFVD